MDSQVNCFDTKFDTVRILMHLNDHIITWYVAKNSSDKGNVVKIGLPLTSKMMDHNIKTEYLLVYRKIIPE